MGKKELKKEIKQLRKEMQNQELRMQLRMFSPMASMSSGSNKDSEAVKDDSYRQEAYAKVGEWVSEDLKAEVDKVQKNYSQLLEEDKKVLKRYEKKINEYSAEVRYLKREIKNMDKKITHLEDGNKLVKTILRHIGFCAGVAEPGASLKKVSKGFKNESRRKYKHGLSVKKSFTKSLKA